MAHKVFVSYCDANIKQAESVYYALKETCWQPWMAKYDIQGGQNHEEEVPKAIDAAEVVVVVLSKEAQESAWVPKELDMSISMRKNIIPLMIDNAPLKRKFRYMLTGVQIVPPMKGSADIQALYDQLKKIYAQPAPQPAQAAVPLTEDEFKPNPIKRPLLLLVTMAVAVLILYQFVSSQTIPEYLVPTGYVCVSDSPVYSVPGGEIWREDAGTVVFEKTDVTVEMNGVTWAAICPVQDAQSNLWAPEENLSELLEAKELIYKKRGDYMPLEFGKVSVSHFRLIRDAELYSAIDEYGKKRTPMMVVPEGTIFFNNDIALDTYSGDVYWQGSYYGASGLISEKDLEWLYTMP